MIPWRQAWVALLGAHVLLTPQWVSLNRRLPADPGALPSDHLLQLSLMLTATLALFAAILALGTVLGRMHRLAAHWIWHSLTVLFLGILARDGIGKAFPWFLVRLDAPPLLWALFLPMLLLLATWLLGLTRANRWLPPLGLFVTITFTGLWLPLAGAAARWAWRRPPAPPPAARQSPQTTVWVLVFDELDGRATQDERFSQRLRRELDAWGTTSYEARRVVSASTDTAPAISGLLLGRAVDTANPGPDGGYRIMEANGARYSWKGEQSLFHAWHAAGGQVRTLGWYFPYETWFGRFAALARQYPAFLGWQGQSQHRPFSQQLLQVLQTVFVQRAWSLPERQETKRGLMMRTQDDLEARVSHLQHSPHAGLNWIHWPIPHPPCLRPGGDYRVSLDQVADVLTRFRQAQLASGAWDREAVIVTSDHGLRPGRVKEGVLPELPQGWIQADGRNVPLIIHLPGAKEGRVSDTPIQAAELRSLILGIQAGRIRTLGDVDSWARQPSMLTQPARP